MGLKELDQLERLLESEPDETIARAQEAFDREITLAELHRAITEARSALTAPRDYLSMREAAIELARTVVRLPDGFTFSGIDLDNIDIEPEDKRFEDSDILGWLLFSGFGWIADKVGALDKADFQWHDRGSAQTGFVYPLAHPHRDDATRIALFSDFGTGTYAARYIAKQLSSGEFPYAVHLGDVYYGGRSSEFESHMAEPLKPLFDAGTRVFLMNANHEMYSGAKPYFDYLNTQRLQYAQQEQEGSYFCLRSEPFQIIGIDTAYHSVGRHRETRLNEWLGNVLRDGRDSGRINILLSQNAPYRYGKSKCDKLLTEDLQGIAEGDLIDLWFWGDTHYCAIYDRGPTTPFIGSCIGHGGKPYPRMKVGEPTAAPMRYLEASARFPRWTKLRQDQGNNGYCVMTLNGSDGIDLQYIDWMSNIRCVARLYRAPGKPVLRIASVMEKPMP
jgi:hypothetical protein